MYLTIFTPVYNRESTIYRLYSSLQEQDCKDFEWLVVDDGSTDSSLEILKELKNSSTLDITLIHQENYGKHVAINNGVNNAKGNLFFIVDSDDYLPKNAVKTIYDCFADLEQCNRIAGISAQKAYDELNVVGNSFENEKGYMDITNLERRKYGIKGDRAEVYFTNVLKKYPFPVFENERFVSEAVVWNKIASDGYKLRFVNKVIYFCEYLQDGLSNNICKVFLNNWKGYTFYVNQEILLRDSFLRKLSIIFSYVYYSKIKGISVKQVLSSLSSASTFLVLIAYLMNPIYKIVIKRWDE